MELKRFSSTSERRLTMHRPQQVPYENYQNAPIGNDLEQKKETD
jgi:hypothetical protein